MRLDDEAEM